MSELEFAASSAKLRGTQMRSPIFPWLALLCATLGTAVAAPAEDGLYAVFQTSRGNFTAKLEFEKVPVTVANFVGLAEGSRPWLDTTAGALPQTPFYNGVTFHRVIPGFMIQSGSRNGLGTDGPGYSFGDEFHPDLAHAAAGVLSMANSGKNSNGAQFFVTLGPTEWLNGKHSVFGRIVEGMNVVLAIGATGTAGGTPTETTTIEGITIVRNGAAAQAFSAPNFPGLPVLCDAKPRMKHQSGAFSLEIPRPAFGRHEFFNSLNLSTWSGFKSLTDISELADPAVDITATAAGKQKEFYRVVTAVYPAQPRSLSSFSILLDLTSAPQTLRFNITAGQGYDPLLSFGSFFIDGSGPGDIDGYFISNTLNALYLDIALAGPGSYSFSFHFNSAVGGWFTAQPYGSTDGLWPIFGTFRIEPLP
jgi:cyclophilin family peptidyl-prolyl cis-trans isomerase